MDNPLRDQIERLVFSPQTPAPTSIPTATAHQGQTPSAVERRATRFRVLNSILTSNASGTGSMSSNPASGAQGNPRDRVLSIQSFETAAYSMVAPPSSPDASQELNGLARVGLPDGSTKTLSTPGAKGQTASGPRRIFSRIFSGLGGSAGKDFKGRRKTLYYDPDYPLDGEEGELIDDEACFVDASQTRGFGE